jgi:hypothetical protein
MATVMTAASEVAWAAHAAGLCVVPPMEDGSKRPDGSWKQFQKVRPSKAQMSSWYGDHSGVGLICGLVSGGLEMLEFEGRAVHEGVSKAFLVRAEEVGLSPLVERIRAGYQERTPSGGIHLLYRCASPRGNTKLARRPALPAELVADPADKVRVLIETRGEGGFTIVAPSNGRVHPDGGAWRLERGSLATIATITDEERDDLYTLARSFDQMPEEEPWKATGQPQGHGDDERPGDWYNALPDVVERTLDVLTRHGWTFVRASGQTLFLRRPGKDIGISATLNHPGGKPGRLINFSSSSEFSTEHSVDPFGVLVQLEHGGDFAAASRALLEERGDGGGGYTLVSSATEVVEEMCDDDEEGWPVPPDGRAFHGVLGDIARVVEPHTEADPIGMMGTFLAMFGCAVGPGPYLYQGSMQRTNLSLLVVGDTSVGRKGTGLGVARDVFGMVDPDFRRFEVPGLASGEGLAGHLSRNGGEPRALLVESEFGRLLTVMNREGSSMSSILRNAWDGVPLGSVRSLAGAIVTNHHVTMVGHITRAELKQKLTTVDAANGFANRILFVAVRRVRLVPFPQSPTWLVQPYVPRLKAVLEAASGRGEMAWDEDARIRWEMFYTATASEPRVGLLGAVTGRHEAMVARLALLYALADGDDQVRVQHLEAGIAFADYARRSAAYALGDSTGNVDADELRGILRRGGDVTWDDAKRELGIRKASEMEAIVSVLTGQGLARVMRAVRADGATGGRPRRVIRSLEMGANGAKGAKGAPPLRHFQGENAA